MLVQLSDSPAIKKCATKLMASDTPVIKNTAHAGGKRGSFIKKKLHLLVVVCVSLVIKIQRTHYNSYSLTPHTENIYTEKEDHCVYWAPRKEISAAFVHKFPHKCYRWVVAKNYYLSENRNSESKEECRGNDFLGGKRTTEKIA
jgi:hypothetical protein